ncbi:MAG TPA: YerC/YecD family TrpR-related protein [Clostridia bacterium]|nr:YerC/YecD family TrpR-related protein [Clostridia bacterium]
MRLSSQKLNPSFEKEAQELLFQIVTDVKGKEEVVQLLTGILTESELISVAKRVATAKFLDEGLSYAEIREKLKISSATISQIQNQIQENPGFQIALEKIRIEQWASDWEGKIKSFFGK